MKKTLWAVLALILMLVSAAAFAEEETMPLFTINDQMVVTLTIDNEAVLEPLEDTSDEIYTIRVTRQSVAPVIIAVTYDDLTQDVSMSDLDDAGIEAVEATMGEKFEHPQFNVEVTDSGDKYIACWDEHDPAYSIMTIYKGYVVELVQYHEDLSEITEDDQNFIREVLNGLSFEELEDAAAEAAGEASDGVQAAN